VLAAILELEQVAVVLPRKFQRLVDRLVGRGADFIEGQGVPDRPVKV